MSAKAFRTTLSEHMFVQRRLGSRAATALLAITLVVLGVTSAIAWDGKVAHWEKDALININSWPDWLEPFMWIIQQPGGILTPAVVGALVYWISQNRNYGLAFTAIIPIKLITEKGIIKSLVERNRPFQSIGPEINVRGVAYEGLSFPSGHTTTAFAIFVLMTAFIPKRWCFAPIAWATGVALARLYNGEHNLLDVVAGAALGTTFAVVLYYFVLNRCYDKNEEPVPPRSSLDSLWQTPTQEQGSAHR